MTRRRRASRGLDLSGIRKLRQDDLAMLFIGAALGAMLLLFIYVGSIYNDLPELLPLHFDTSGAPDRIDNRRDLLLLPTIAAVVNLVNLAAGLWLRIRLKHTFAPYLLWSGALLVQLLLWIAVWNIVH